MYLLKLLSIQSIVFYFLFSRLQSVTNDVWWYYMCGSAFYWSLMLSQFFDNKRKDYWVMFIHHLSTICLLGFSWTCNLTRIGTLVLVLHDCADASLEVYSMKDKSN